MWPLLKRLIFEPQASFIVLLNVCFVLDFSNSSIYEIVIFPNFLDFFRYFSFLRNCPPIQFWILSNFDLVLQTNHKFIVVGIEQNTKNVTGNAEGGKIEFSETGMGDVQEPVETCFHACFPVSKLNGMHQRARVQG